MNTVAADAERFTGHVDFPKLRESLKGQLSARIGKETGERAGNSFGGMLAMALADKMIDVAVRPETVMFAMREGKFRIGSADGRDGGRDQGERNTDEHRKVVWSTERKGLNTILFRAERDGGGAARDQMALVMQREGFANWKLTDIRLPE